MRSCTLFRSYRRRPRFVAFQKGVTSLTTDGSFSCHNKDNENSHEVVETHTWRGVGDHSVSIRSSSRPFWYTKSSPNNDSSRWYTTTSKIPQRNWSSSPSSYKNDERLQKTPQGHNSDSSEHKNGTLPESSSNMKPRLHQRVWYASEDKSNETTAHTTADKSETYSYWTDRVVDRLASSRELEELYRRIEAQEVSGGRLRQRQLGVLHQDPFYDIQLLTDNYTVKAVASALRDREDALQYAAVLAHEKQWDELAEHLRVFHPRYVLDRRFRKGGPVKKQPHGSTVTESSISGNWAHRGNLELIRRALMRMPRLVTQAHSQRAGVVIALCTVEGVPCVLLEKRARHLRAHPDEICLPGGMVCDVQDQSIVSTSVREMKEEIGGLDDNDPDVLGVFRCNWGEIHHLVNMAVTPVVCWLGELPEQLKPNHDEVSQVFTVPLASLMDKSLWVHREGLAPIFVGGPEVIWGLSGYILERFAKDILMPNSRLAGTRTPLQQSPSPELFEQEQAEENTPSSP